MKVQLQRCNDGRLFLTLLHNNGSLPSATWFLKGNGKDYREDVHFLENNRVEEPVLAEQLGWTRKIGNETCPHVSTDGTVDCLECGIPSNQFYTSAKIWLLKHLDCIFPAEKVEHYFL